MEFVEIATHDDVVLVRLSRPPVNALSDQVGQELDSAFELCQDPSVRAVVLTGKPHFAAGADIKKFKETLESGDKDVSAEALKRAIVTLEELKKPTIAAVHGFALGGGCELSLGCDFRYLAEDAQIGQPEINLGIIPGAGGTQRLQRLIGFQKTKDLVFTGRHVGAEEALALGYADKVAPTDELLDLAMADAAQMATMPTVAIGAAKRAMADGRGVTLSRGMGIEAEAFQESWVTEDALEGITAFVEKRKPQFKGK